MMRYRALWEYRTNAAGCYGWNSRVEVFDSEAAAIAAISKPFPAGTKKAFAQIDAGKSWKTIARRNRGQDISNV